MTNDTTNDASAPAAGPHPGGYEFDAAQETVIRELAGSMQFFGTGSVVVAVVLWLLGIAIMFMGNSAGLGPVIQGVLFVFIGVWTRSSAKWFQLVVDTKGSDVPHLMNALGELRRLYNLLKWVVILAGVLFVVILGLQIITFVMVARHTGG